MRLLTPALYPLPARCPNYSPLGQSTPNTATAQSATFKLPVKPILSDSLIYVSAFLDDQGTANPNGGSKVGQQI